MEDSALNELATELEEMKQRAQINREKYIIATAHIENGKGREKRYREKIRKLKAEIKRLKKI